MTSSELIFYTVVFLVFLGITFLVVSRLLPSALERRVQELTAETPVPRHPEENAKPAHWIESLAAPLARPAMQQGGGWEQSPIRVRFYNAGYRSLTAPIVYFAAKTVLTFALPGLFLLYALAWDSSMQPALLLALTLVFAAVGYYLPNAVLSRLVSIHQRELFEAFPDALDLMRVCVEAGLGLDAAIERVGREMALESGALSDEFRLVGLELRAGSSRANALRNMALRVGLEDIDALVSMLVQADRFGTSIAESLQVHSEALRTKRRLTAEEAAAKLPVKLLIPLIFCVFPALLTVLLGPAAISVMQILIPRMSGQ